MVNRLLKFFFAIGLFCISFPTLAEDKMQQAQEPLGEVDDPQSSNGKTLISPGTVFFVPYSFLQIQGGLAYDIGEAKFAKLTSPALQFSFGYQYSELFSLRGSLNGAWAKNRYAFPESSYKWNFVQGTLDAQVNLLPLFLGSKPDRKSMLNLFVGAGVNYSFNNDDAVKANNNFNNTLNALDARYKKIAGVDNPNPRQEIFQKLWKDNRWNPVLKFGMSYDYFVSEQLAIGAEVNASLLPDHFNSKLGRHDNKDWHLNALVGIKYSFGKRYGKTPARYREAPKVQAAQPKQFVDVPIDKISFNVNIYFVINQSIIRQNQVSKLTRLLKYLNDHPRAFVRLSGYADRETGNPTINMRLSRERAQAVSKYLVNAGIEDWRIRRFAKGDKVQPFDIPEDNRVCICYVYDPDNPERQDNW